MTRRLTLFIATIAATGCATEEAFPVQGATSPGGSGDLGSGADGGVVEAPSLDPTCTTDTVLIGPYGRFFTDSVSDLVPLCDGLVALGDRTGNQISVHWIGTGAPVAAQPLNAAPGDLELDGPRGLLFATLAGQDGLARVDLVNETVSNIALAGDAVDLAIADDGELFANIEGSAGVFERPIVHLDGVAGEVLGTGAIDSFSHFVVWDGPNDQLIAGVEEYSPSTLRRYAFDDEAETMTETQELGNAGGNCQDLALSVNGRLAFACGGGNVDGYTIVDYASNDLESTAGEWNTGAYPSSAAFSPDGRYLAATNSRDLLIYDVATHREVAAMRVNVEGCSYTDLRRVEWSRGGRYVFGLADCGPDRDAALVVWMRFEPT